MITYIDLFAGCGGLSEGFESVNLFDPLAFVEWEKDPCCTLLNRLEYYKVQSAEKKVLNFDIQRTEELLNGWKNDPHYGSNIGLKSLVSGRSVDLIIGGPPCQAYSIAGRVQDKNGMQFDYRNYLFESYMAIVNEFKPKLFVFENVQGILSAKPGGMPIIERIFDAFNKCGYLFPKNLEKLALLNAADYGVPQNRNRVIILGVNKKVFGKSSEDVINDFYLKFLPSMKDKKMTVRQALKGLPDLLPLKEPRERKQSHHYHDKKISNHIPRFHSLRDQEIFHELALDKENGCQKYPSTNSLIELYFKITGRRSNFHKHHVLDWNSQSNTIPSHLYKDGLRHIHPDPKQKRSITPREAARLQSFPDSFHFLGPMGSQYEMIGNAVPPLLSKKIAHCIKLIFDTHLKR